MRQIYELVTQVIDTDVTARLVNVLKYNFGIWFVSLRVEKARVRYKIEEKSS